MDNHNIVIGQRISPDKTRFARRLRRDQTPEEQLLWERFRANRLEGLHFRRQQIIDGFIADFYCHAAGLVIEVDGPVHLSQREDDAVRDEILQSRGLTVLRVTNEEVRRDIESVLRRVITAIGDPLPVSGRGRGKGP